MPKEDQLAALQIVSGETLARAAQDEATPLVECAFTALGIGRALALGFLNESHNPSCHC